MRQKSGPEKQPAEDAIKAIRRATRRHFSAEDKIRIVLEGLRGEDSIAELCRRCNKTFEQPNKTDNKSPEPGSKQNKQKLTCSRRDANGR